MDKFMGAEVSLFGRYKTSPNNHLSNTVPVGDIGRYFLGSTTLVFAAVVRQPKMKAAKVHADYSEKVKSVNIVIQS